ncbi:LysR family transcriptional regulator [Pseudomonas straminea]|uniref:DNA-binding transcriptional regulator, LysR family n=1 Tax=Pseudomonas straminea TaxID=47882 RepID=A0A1I1YAV6_PSEOC|nr:MULTISPECIES: LysR family transcriptional regulator [Pseudomonas]TWD99143.1 DNA-binding transcriptional LysR family regulator [Pseudomonas sp. AG1028]GLX15745.1 LysR family transcriptional regulator [Pseudomonas straminea]SFE16737.1 DNA-binding transcriptional regulator, LysR family [Pseudomonas straminea]
MAQDLPSLNALHAFEAAARLGSVSRAALELHVTHGAVSRQIRTLEEQLGVSLFAKDGRGLKLTEAGLRLRDVSGETFARLRQVCGELRQREADMPFVLGCPGSLLARWFIPRLDRLNSALPDLHLQLSTSQGELDPRSPQVDATLLYAEPPWPADMQVFELARESIGPVLSPQHPRFTELSAAAPGALLNEALLHTTSRPQAWPQWLAAMHLDPAAMRLGQGFEHLYYLLEAASAGLGVAIAPLQLVADDLKARRLVAPWGFVETDARLALWVPERRSGGRAERLADWLRSELQIAQ